MGAQLEQMVLHLSWDAAAKPPGYRTSGGTDSSVWDAQPRDETANANAGLALRLVALRARAIDEVMNTVARSDTEDSPKDRIWSDRWQSIISQTWYACPGADDHGGCQPVPISACPTQALGHGGPRAWTQPPKIITF